MHRPSRCAAVPPTTLSTAKADVGRRAAGLQEAGGSPPLAMHLYQLNPRALAATNWLREGSVASDWWQMPTEDGARPAPEHTSGEGRRSSIHKLSYAANH